MVQTTNKELHEYLQEKRAQRQESSKKLAELKTQQAEQTRLQVISEHCVPRCMCVCMRASCHV